MPSWHFFMFSSKASASAGEMAATLTITLEYIPQLTQCAPEDFDTVWAEFVSKLDELPLDEYEELATQMIQEGAANYQN